MKLWGNRHVALQKDAQVTIDRTCEQPWIFLYVAGGQKGHLYLQKETVEIFLTNNEKRLLGEFNTHRTLKEREAEGNSEQATERACVNRWENKEWEGEQNNITKNYKEYDVVESCERHTSCRDMAHKRRWIRQNKLTSNLNYSPVWLMGSFVKSLSIQGR